MGRTLPAQTWRRIAEPPAAVARERATSTRTRQSSWKTSASLINSSCRKPLPSLFLARTPSENAASSAAGPESAAISASIAGCLNATGPDRGRAAARDAGQRSARQLINASRPPSILPSAHAAISPASGSSSIRRSVPAASATPIRPTASAARIRTAASWEVRSALASTSGTRASSIRCKESAISAEIAGKVAKRDLGGGDGRAQASTSGTTVRVTTA